MELPNHFDRQWPTTVQDFGHAGAAAEKALEIVPSQAAVGATETGLPPRCDVAL